MARPLKAPDERRDERLPAPRVTAAERLQISAGDPPRSAFFEMADLRKALGLQARICSWSGF